DLPLALEALQVARRDPVGAAEHLERDLAAVLAVARAVDDAVGAAPELGREVPRPEAGRAAGLRDERCFERPVRELSAPSLVAANMARRGSVEVLAAARPHRPSRIDVRAPRRRRRGAEALVV